MSDEIRGRVAAVNDSGVQLEGEEDWRNFTKEEWRGKPFDEAQVGDEVSLALSKDGEWVRSVAVRNGAREEPPRGAPVVGAAPAGMTMRDTLIARESAIKSAIELLSHHKPWVESSIADKQKGLRVVAVNMHTLIVHGFAPAAEPKPEPEPEPAEFPFE